MVGIPLLTPSFMYEGVHTIHHKRTQYGTAEDPEYLALALMKPWSLPLFVIVALLAPIALLVRFAALVPLGALIPAVRTFTWERFSSLSINPDFRRKPPTGDFARRVPHRSRGAAKGGVDHFFDGSPVAARSPRPAARRRAAISRPVSGR